MLKIPLSDKWTLALEKQGIRGDYTHMRSDYTVDQKWEDYIPEQHALYHRLYERQIQLLSQYACPEIIKGIQNIDGEKIPHLEAVSDCLEKVTSWRLVGVPGFIPDAVFFGHLANRCFPVTLWLRKPEEFEYIVEPDVFHDLFGHVPLLFNPFFADYMQAFGKMGLQAHQLNASPLAARLYWFTVEFGLIQTNNGLKVYGAGLLSSSGEIVYSIDSSLPNRQAFDLKTVINKDYRIDKYQENYFFIEKFEDLVQQTTQDFINIYNLLKEENK